MDQSVAKVLNHEYQKRNHRSTYSLRAFARDLDVSPSALSRIMKGTRGISSLKARSLAKKLKLNEPDEKKFLRLAELEFARSPQLKQNAQIKLETLNEEHFSLPTDQYEIIANWHGFAILSLLETKHLRQDTKWIARRLGITPEQTEHAIALLLRFGLLKKVNAKLKTSGKFFVDPANPIPIARFIRVISRPRFISS
jgi:uncharacterized protein (TIGR02147 family)